MTAQPIMPVEPTPNGAWQELSLCRQVDNEIFFAEKGGSTKEAKKICLRCEVRENCLQYAIDGDQHFGVWGGASERERRRMKQKHSRIPVLSLVPSLDITPKTIIEHADPTIPLPLLHAYLNDQGIEEADWRVKIINSLPVAWQDGVTLIYSKEAVDAIVAIEFERMARQLEAKIPSQRKPLADEKLSRDRAKILRDRAISNYRFAAENAPSIQAKAYWSNRAAIATISA